MRLTTFDAHNNAQITVDIEGSYFPRIISEGYYIIPNPSSKHVSFSKHRADSCLGDITANIIPDYTNAQYAAEYGDRLTGMGCTVREFMVKNLRIEI
jgi:hypothetical protein